MMESGYLMIAPQPAWPGFCKSARRANVARHGTVMTRYVGAEDDGVLFEERIKGLKSALSDQLDKVDEIQVAISSYLGNLKNAG